MRGRRAGGRGKGVTGGGGAAKMFSSVVFLLYIVQESNIENICVHGVFYTFSPSQLVILASSRFLLLISNLFTKIKFYQAEIKNGLKSLFQLSAHSSEKIWPSCYVFHRPTKPFLFLFNV